MLPKGLFGIVSSAAIDCDEVRRSLNALLDEDEYYESRSDATGTGILGVICSSRYPYVKCVSTSADHTHIGAIDGSSFHGARLDKQPHSLFDGDLALPDEANGILTCCAWNSVNLRLLVDPLGSTPLYYRYNDEFFAFSSSLALLTAIDVLPPRAYSNTGMAEFLCWGRVLNGQTVFQDVFKLQAAELLEFSFAGNSPQRRRYWRPSIGKDVSNHAIGRTVEAFSESVAGIVRSANDPLCVSLSGGYDSRTILSVLMAKKLEFLSTTHAICDGHDIRISKAIAVRYDLNHNTVWIDGIFSSGFRNYAIECATRSNGMLPLDSSHLPFVYASNASYHGTLVDGILTVIEKNFGLRRRAARARSRQDIANVFWHNLTSGRLNAHDAENPDTVEGEIDYVSIARRELHEIVPDPTAWDTPGNCTDTFFLEHIVGNQFMDAVCLQQHYNRFATPYYDLNYIKEVSRVPEKLRSANAPQQEIMRTHCPSLLWFPRSYTDIRTLPIPNIWVQLLPVVFDRIVKQTVPGARARKLLKLPTMDYTRFAKPIDSLAEELMPVVESARLSHLFELAWRNPTQATIHSLLSLCIMEKELPVHGAIRVFKGC